MEKKVILCLNSADRQNIPRNDPLYHDGSDVSDV